MAEPTLPFTLTNGTTANASEVQQNDQALLDGITDGTKDIEVMDATINGDTILGNSAADTVTWNAVLSSHVIPGTNTTYDLGSGDVGFRSVYIGGSSTFTTRLIGGTQAADIVLTLPTAVAAVRAPLTSDTAGVMYWAPMPTIQKFLSGSGTYTTPSAPSPRYIRVRMVGGGGGGGGGGVAPGTGGTGGTTTFGADLSAAGGAGGANNTGGTGGTATLGTVTTGFALSGGPGGSVAIQNSTPTDNGSGGGGGNSAFGGGGASAPVNAGVAGTTNTGGGGGGAGVGSTVSAVAGGGGGAGGYVEALIATPAATYAYAVGAAGTAGTAGSGGGNAPGGAGGSGIIIVEEFY